MSTHGHETREKIARREIGHTDSAPGVNIFLTGIFLLVIALVPLSQNVFEMAAIWSGRETRRSFPQSWDVFLFFRPRLAELKAIVEAVPAGRAGESVMALNRRIMADIDNYEQELKDRNKRVQAIVPYMQAALTGVLGGGSEEAYRGRDGWLFFRPDIDSLTGPGFLEPRVLARRSLAGSEIEAPPQPDPVKAIVDFRDRLAERDISLIVMPAPVKPTVYPDKHSARYRGRRQPVQNPSFGEFRRRLEQAGVELFDPAMLLLEARQGGREHPLYLRTDTHWTPAGMELAARALARRARQLVELPPPREGRFAYREQEIEQSGDIARMLNLPGDSRWGFPPETVSIRQVMDGDGYWRPRPSSPVLLLGDSFANIYSRPLLGWGESAGLAEHLSLALGLPLDAITRNDAGAYATRSMLDGELRRGIDRLAGKRLVIWQFAARELAFGDWRILPLELGKRRESDFYLAPPGERVPVKAVVQAVSASPRPGAVPYGDHVIMLHLAELEIPGDPASFGKEAVALTWSMRDHVASPAARYRPGDRVQLKIRPWSEVADRYDTVKRGELDDERLLFAELNWAEE